MKITIKIESDRYGEVMQEGEIDFSYTMSEEREAKRKGKRAVETFIDNFIRTHKEIEDKIVRN